MYIFFLATGLAVTLFLFFAALVSYFEHENRAVRFFLGSAFVTILIYGLLLISVKPLPELFLWVMVGLPAGLAILLILPIDLTARHIKPSPKPNFRFDERDIMFSRRLLKPGSKRFEDYYRAHPREKELDDVWRKKPGLLSPKARFYDPVWFNAADSSFETVERMHPFVDGEMSPETINLDPESITKFLKDWLLRSGAHSVGVTELQEYHWYSHLGRQEPYGAPVEAEHRFALAFTVEMNKDMVGYAPFAPTVLESADQYLRAGILAVKVAALIRKLGYPARAHIDGNYRIICPLVARDAGLGEIGRMGLLMTPELGPRVRIGVITTDLPLKVDGYTTDKTMIDFCLQCSKCADNCPSKAIPFGDRQWNHNILRWKINPEACYTYWTISGTDCARCIQVCPYSHPDNLLHGLVRKAVKRNSLARTLAVKMDDVVYGRKPVLRNIPLSFGNKAYRENDNKIETK